MFELPVKLENEGSELLEELEDESNFTTGRMGEKALPIQTNMFSNDDTTSDKKYCVDTLNQREMATVTNKGCHFTENCILGPFAKLGEASTGMPVNEPDFMHIDVGPVKIEWPKTEPRDAMAENNATIQNITAKRSREISPDSGWNQGNTQTRPKRPDESALLEAYSHQGIDTDSLLSESTPSEHLRCESPLPELSTFLSESLLQLPPLSPPAGKEFPTSFLPVDQAFNCRVVVPASPVDRQTRSKTRRQLAASDAARRSQQYRQAEFSPIIGSNASAGNISCGSNGNVSNGSNGKSCGTNHENHFEKPEAMEYILKNYHKGGINTNDTYIYCDLCNRKWKGSCSVHGALAHIKDSRVPVNTYARAERTTPKGLIVSTSGIKGANNGVWSCKTVSARSVYGPYAGAILPTNHECGEYCWEVTKDGKAVHYVDGSDPNRSNWMRYVNCARNVSEQNLEAFQHHGKIYYRTTRKIEPNEELLVWYGFHSAQKLGINWKDFVQSRKPSQADMAFSCTSCFHAFANAIYLARHKNYCRGTVPQTGSSRYDELSDEESSRKADDYSFQSSRSQQRTATCMKVTTGDKPITCGVCGARFRCRGSLLEAHMKTHDGAKHSCCTKCGQWFPHSTSLKIHTDNDHGHTEKKIIRFLNKKPQKSVSPIKSVNNKPERSMSTDDDSYSVAEGKPFTCLECKCSFYSKSALERHVTRRNANISKGVGQPDRKLSTCSLKTVQSESRLGRKRNSFAGPSFPAKKKQGVACRQSRSQTTSQELCRLLTDMNQSLTGDGSHCKSSSTTNPADTTIFQEAEQVLKSLKKRTDDCHSKRSASASKNGENNAPAFKKPSEKTLLCDMCGALFWRRVTLETHMEIRHDIPSKKKVLFLRDGPKRFKCNLCGIRYREKSTLELHLRVHENDTSDDREESDDDANKKPFECRKCGVSFKAEMTLKYHMQIHKDELSNEIEVPDEPEDKPNKSSKKPFKCNECGTRYRALFTLNAHMKIHKEQSSSTSTASGSKLYFSCLQCKALFKTPLALDMHLKAHQVPSLTSAMDRAVSKSQAYSSSSSTNTASSNITSKGSEEKPFPAISRFPKDTNNRKKQQVEKVKFPGRRESVSDKSSLGQRTGSYTGTGTSPSQNDNTGAGSVSLSDADILSGKESGLPKLQRSMHDDKEKSSLKCDICSCQFYWSNALAAHRKSHFPARYECLACGLSFKERTALDAHVREHIREKEFFCDLSAVRLPA